MLALFLRCHSITETLNLCRSFNEGGEWGLSIEREVERGPDAGGIGWRASVLRDEEAGRFREVAGVSIVAAGSPCSR